MVAAGRERLRRYNWRANAQILLDHLHGRLLAAAHPFAKSVPEGST